MRLHSQTQVRHELFGFSQASSGSLLGNGCCRQGWAGSGPEPRQDLGRAEFVRLHFAQRSLLTSVLEKPVAAESQRTLAVRGRPLTRHGKFYQMPMGALFCKVWLCTLVFEDPSGCHDTLVGLFDFRTHKT